MGQPGQVAEAVIKGPPVLCLWVVAEEDLVRKEAEDSQADGLFCFGLSSHKCAQRNSVYILYAKLQFLFSRGLSEKIVHFALPRPRRRDLDGWS